MIASFEHMKHWQRATLLFILFVAIGLALSWNSLSYPWFWDDFHLVRPYSPGELVQGLHGNWDPDSQETSGYRPLALLFNHARASIFGESVVAHRAFDIALVAGYLSLLGLVAQRLGSGSQVVALAGLIFLVNAHSWTDLLWIADAIHAFGGLFFVLSSLTLMAAIECERRWMLVISLVLAGLALLVREDTLAVYPLIIALALAWVVREYWLCKETLSTISKRIRMIGVDATILVIMAVALLVVRRLLVPTSSLNANPLRWLRQIYFLFVPMDHAFDPIFPILGLALTLFAVILCGRVLRREDRIQAWFWLGCAVVAASSGLVVGRINTLFLPSSFFALFLATVFVGWATISRRSLLASGVLLAALIVGAAGVNVLSQEAMNPYSTDALQTMGAYVWGPLRTATLPGERREFIVSHLREAGISSHADMLRAIADAQQHGRDRPNPDNAPFVPRIRFLNPHRNFEPCEPSGPMGGLVLARQPCPGNPNFIGE